MVVSCSTDKKTLERIRKAIKQNVSPKDQEKIMVVMPDELFNYLDTQVAKEASSEKLIKGYRVKVEYDALSDEDMDKKRAAIGKAVLQSKNRHKK
jgi:hypothetical protein